MSLNYNSVDSAEFAVSGAGSVDLDEVRAKLDHFKHWSISTYKCTKQAVYEHLGKCERTVDADMEQKIDMLRQQVR